MSAKDKEESEMRKVVYALAISLDNFIARHDGAVDWLFMEGEQMKDFAESFKLFDAVLMGRKTYDFGVSHGMTSYPNMKNYVFSRTLEGSPDKRVEIVAKNPSEFVKGLKREAGKSIWLCGGGELAATLLNDDLVDEIILNVHPVLLGSGIPFFSKIKKQVDLELTNSKVYPNGLALLSYSVKR